MKINRRELLCAAPAVLSAGRASGETPALPLFPTGPLASNPVARRFTASPGLAAPDATLLGTDGPHKLGELGGKIHIVTLWAEWCAPCLIELPDLAALNDRHGGARFGVLAVLTDSRKKLGVAQADTLLRARGAALPLWVEPNGGGDVNKALAQGQAPAGGLPCNLLVDARGRIRGRSFGVVLADKVDLPKDRPLSDVDKQKLLSSKLRTSWSGAAADAFVNALVGGALG